MGLAEYSRHMDYHCLFRSCNFKSAEEFALDAHMKVHFESAGAFDTNVKPLLAGYEEPGRQRLIASSVAADSTGAFSTGASSTGVYSTGVSSTGRQQTALSPVTYTLAAHSTDGRYATALDTEPPVPEYAEPIHQCPTASSIVARSTAAPFIMPTTDGLYRYRNGGRFKCPVCPKAIFGLVDDFRRHLRKHVPGVRPYECPELGCSYKGELGFYRKDKLTDHLRNRHGRHIPKRYCSRDIALQRVLAPSVTASETSGQAANRNTLER